MGERLSLPFRPARSLFIITVAAIFFILRMFGPNERAGWRSVLLFQDKYPLLTCLLIEAYVFRIQFLNKLSLVPRARELARTVGVDFDLRTFARDLRWESFACYPIPRYPIRCFKFSVLQGFAHGILCMYSNRVGVPLLRSRAGRTSLEFVLENPRVLLSYPNVRFLFVSGGLVGICFGSV